MGIQYRENVVQLVIMLTIFSCGKKGEEPIQDKPTSQKQAKILMESIHDPIVTLGKVEYNPKSSNNSIITKSIYSNNGSLTSRSIFNSLGNLKSKTDFQYDRKGNISQTNFYSSNGKLSRKRVNSFDSNDTLLESNEFDENGKKVEKQSVSFNNDGYKVITSFKIIGGNLIKSSESVLDDQGLNIENYYFTNETLVRSEINKFDLTGNKIKISEYDHVNNHDRVVHYKFDNRNNNTEVVELNSSLMITSKVICKFNENRELTDSMTIDILGNVKRHVKFIYEYDEANNWTKKICFINSKPVSVTVHRIEYY